MSEKPVNGQEYCGGVLIEGLEAGDTVSSEQKEVSPAFQAPAMYDLNTSPSHGLRTIKTSVHLS